MTLDTCLRFDGDCRDALEFYAGLLGGRITAMRRFGQMPGCDGLPAAASERIMHGSVEFDGRCLSGTDATPGHPDRGVQGAYVALNVEQPDQAERLFAALADGGRIEMPLQPTFWARRYGIAVDRFGVAWRVSCAPAEEVAA